MTRSYISIPASARASDAQVMAADNTAIQKHRQKNNCNFISVINATEDRVLNNSHFQMKL